MNWEDILKVQVLDTSTGLSTISEPMIEDRDCCEEARQKFINMYDDIPPNTKVSIEEWSCERLKNYLIKFSSWLEKPKDRDLKPRTQAWIDNQHKILDEWEECENE
tara:strand:- start:284 stop:601 length:318 start_codon:yes stop_codon:yes gene_type:complete